MTRKYFMTNVSNKMAYENSADQIRLLQEQSDQGLHCLPFDLVIYVTAAKKKKSRICAKKVSTQVFKILGHLPYFVLIVTQFSLAFCMTYSLFRHPDV